MTRLKRPRRRYTQCRLDCIAVAESLHNVMPIGDGDVPVEVLAWFLGGSLRRVRADYPNGWRLQFSINEKGFATRVCASLHIPVKGVPA
jgi:hypothetical protein